MGTGVSSSSPSGSGGGGSSAGGRGGPSTGTNQTCLDDYAENAGPTERQGKTIDERRQRIQDILEDQLDIVDSHQFGSFTRGTMVGPMNEDSDTDVMFVLDERSHGKWITDENGSMNCLRAVKRALKEKYPQSDVSIDRNVVAVQFHDFTVEVAPAFRDQSGGYRIPDTYSEGRSWIRTDPRGYKQRFDAVNQARGGNLQKVARVAKKFRQNKNVPVSAYHMEVMAYQYVRNHPNKNASTEELVEGFFDQLPQRLSRGTRDPVNNDRVDSNMDSKARRQAIRDARRAREHIEDARKHREKGDTKNAEKKYGEAVGEEVSNE